MSRRVACRSSISHAERTSCCIAPTAGSSRARKASSISVRRPLRHRGMRGPFFRRPIGWSGMPRNGSTGRISASRHSRGAGCTERSTTSTTASRRTRHVQILLHRLHTLSGKLPLLFEPNEFRSIRTLHCLNDFPTKARYDPRFSGVPSELIRHLERVRQLGEVSPVIAKSGPDEMKRSPGSSRLPGLRYPYRPGSSGAGEGAQFTTSLPR